MKTFIHKSFIGLIAVLLATISAAAVAAGSPFVSSSNEPHAVLHLNYKMIPRQIYPVRVWMVDGKPTNRSNQSVVWMKPGDYILTIKLTKVVNMDYTPGLTQKMPDAKQMHDLKVRLQAGTDYYVGAKFDSSGNWQPQVWKTEAVKH